MAKQSTKRTLENNEQVSSLQISQNEFSARMIKALWKNENVVVSPFSIFVALSMSLVGSDGETFEEISKALSIRCDRKNFEEWKQEELKDYLNGISDQVLKHNQLLSVANKMFISKSIQVKDTFKNDLIDLYDSEIKSDCDFAGNPDGEAREINQWVSAATNNKIQNIINPNMINSLTSLILVNAIHFLGNWAEQFDKEKTIGKHVFHTTNGKINCNMMTKHSTESKNKLYGSDGDYHYLQMPYTNEDYAMIFAAPDDNVELDEESEKVFSEWFSTQLQNVKKNFNFSKTSLSTIKIPRFEVTQCVELSQMLQTDFHMKTAFSNLANFEPIAPSLKIDDVIHKAFIRVDEEGTEAAAATAVIMRKKSKGSEPLPEFVLDRPFGYALIHLPTRSVLFCGRIVKP